MESLPLNSFCAVAADFFSGLDRLLHGSSDAALGSFRAVTAANLARSLGCPLEYAQYGICAPLSLWILPPALVLLSLLTSVVVVVTAIAAAVVAYVGRILSICDVRPRDRRTAWLLWLLGYPLGAHALYLLRTERSVRHRPIAVLNMAYMVAACTVCVKYPHWSEYFAVHGVCLVTLSAIGRAVDAAHIRSWLVECYALRPTLLEDNAPLPETCADLQVTRNGVRGRDSMHHAYTAVRRRRPGTIRRLIALEKANQLCRKLYSWSPRAAMSAKN